MYSDQNMFITTSTISGYLLYFMSTIALTFWIVIWIMHICALTNAKLKLNKRSYTSAASKRKRKLKHLKERYMSNIFNSRTNNCNNTLNKLDLICPEYTATTGTNNNSGSNNYDPEFFSEKQLKDSMSKSNNPSETGQTSLATIVTSPPQETLTQSLLSPSNYSFRQQNERDFYLHKNTKQTNDIISYSYINLPLPGVSIIKPLVGVDANLNLNLKTFFEMDYPNYELLFCVQDPDDAAILIVKNLIKLYPEVDAKLFIGGSSVGVNPKINNMQPAYEATKYELILISDSGISMKKDTLLDMVGHMSDDIALVHQMPFVCDGREGFQSVFEKVYFGTAHARAYLTADLLNINCPTGMSALMRKNLLDEVGGIKAFGQYLAEDFFFAKSFTNRGWKISISSQPAWQNSSNSSDTLSTLNSRIQRWVKLRFAMVPQWTLLEPFSECMLLGLLGAISISFLWPLDPFAIFLFHVLLWFLSDYKLLCLVQGGPLTFSKTDFLIAWLIRECTALLVFSRALLDPKVTWRSRNFRLKWGGYAEEIIT